MEDEYFWVDAFAETTMVSIKVVGSPASPHDCLCSIIVVMSEMPALHNFSFLAWHQNHDWLVRIFVWLFPAFAVWDLLWLFAVKSYSLAQGEAR